MKFQALEPSQTELVNRPDFPKQKKYGRKQKL